MSKIVSKEYIRIYKKVFSEMAGSFPEMAYESSVPSYLNANRLMAWLFWQRIDVALGLAGVLPGGKVLDLGCGTGVLFKYFHGQKCSITACDRTSRKLAEYTCDSLNIKVDLFDELHEIPAKKFDYIFALDVLEHVKDLDDTMARIIAFCHQKTCFIISGPSENLFYKMGRLLAGFTGEYHVRNIYDIERKVDSNFALIDLRRLFFPLTFFRISAWEPQL